MKKKIYLAPEIQVVEIEAADIIATSGKGEFTDGGGDFFGPEEITPGTW